FEDSPVGQLMENIMASMSEWYSANLGEEIKKGAHAKLQRGEWPAGPPVGYKSERGVDKKVRHVPDEVRAPLVREAFELYATGQYSYELPGEEMGDRGLLTRRGRPYSAEMIRSMLARLFYVGRFVWAGNEYAGGHEHLIPETLFYQVQEVMQQRHVDTGEKGR